MSWKVMVVLVIPAAANSRVCVSYLPLLLFAAIRLTIGAKLLGRGGYVNGSYADASFIEGEYEDGGDAIHLNNGQSGPETASKAEFYDGVHVIGGDAPVGVGGECCL